MIATRTWPALPRPSWALKLGALAVLVASGCGGSGQATETSEADLRRLERSRLEALVQADEEVLEKLHADDFELINPYGERYDREEYLGQILRGRLDYSAWTAGEMAVRVRHGLAVIRYQDLEFEAWFDGELVSEGKLVHTDVYELRDGAWQIVWSQASGGL